MSNNPFYKLSGFIQEWIFSHGWDELRDIQIEACRIIFETDKHMLLSTGTASGKTEAAFLPAITEIYENPPASIGILYIGPLKALINDQFQRLEELLDAADVPVWRWHGDVPRNLKQKMLKHPSGVLQITPESLESLLINKTVELRRIFGDLQFIVIDEVHVFMSSERGRQVQSQLERLGKYFMKEPRRIGLSATLGDYQLAEQWLQGATGIDVITPAARGLRNKRLKLAVEHFFHPNPNPTSFTEPARPSGGKFLPAHQYVYEQTLGTSSLIFTNRRDEAEFLVASLKEIARKQGTPDYYYVHHGAVSGELRESTESIIKDPNQPSVTAATLTLELGIDIGSLERIVQLHSPFSVSSFLQRLGRSGRRTGVSEMLFVHYEPEPSENKPIHELIPWQLLQSIAIIQLYLEERWIEPILPHEAPFSLLYHQTMSILASSGELSPAALAQRVLTLSPFKNISMADFKQLLKHLLEIDHLERMEDGGLILGIEGEKIVRNFRFYAVFQDSVEITVKDTTREIGRIAHLPNTGERIPLAGFVWEVTDVYPEQKAVLVEKVAGKMRYFWPGPGMDIHTKVLKRMRKILFEDTRYKYLQPGALKRIDQARKLARIVHVDKHVLFQLAGKKWCIMPWIGSIAYRTLQRLLDIMGKDSLGISRISGWAPYYLRFEADDQEPERLEPLVKALVMQANTPRELVDPDEQFLMNKYDKYLPKLLQQKVLAEDYLDLEELQQLAKDWK
ncbi:DEAD/DEAH box helicase [Candidatus Bathyarchaeota archaeon]|nr:DEAD/DEAH box helicase [Candidatus Bathyarchaeota archaeon]